MGNINVEVTHNSNVIAIHIDGPSVFSQVMFDVRDIGYPSVAPASIANSQALPFITAYRVPGISKVLFLEADPTGSTQGGNDDYAISAATGALFQKQEGQWVQIAGGPQPVSFLGALTLSGFRVIFDMGGRIASSTPLQIQLGSFDFNYTNAGSAQ